MRTYPKNSPQAAARIVALAMLADGNLCKAELDALERSNAYATLELQPAEWHEIVHGFCEDLLTTAHQTWGGTCKLDPQTMASLLAEIDSPKLRKEIMRICISVVHADKEITEGETIMLSSAFAQWGQRQTTKISVAPELSRIT